MAFMVRAQERKKAALVDRLFRRLEHRDSDSDEEEDDEHGMSHFDRARGARRLHKQQQQQQPAQQQDEESMVVGQPVASRVKLAKEEMAAAWNHTIAPPPSLSAVVAASAAARVLAQRQQQRRPALPPVAASAASAPAPAGEAAENTSAASNDPPLAADPAIPPPPPAAPQDSAVALTPWTEDGVVVTDDARSRAEQRRGPKRPSRGSARTAAMRPSSARPSSASSASSNGSAGLQPQPPREKRHRGSQRRVKSARTARQQKKASEQKHNHPRVPLRSRPGNSSARAQPAAASMRQRSTQQAVKSRKKSARQKPAAGPGGRIDTGRKGEDLGKRMELRRLQQIWKRVDSDGSGTLDHDEVKAIFREMGKNLSQREFMRAIDQIDADGSGEVDFKEFAAYWDRTMTAAGVVVPSTFKFQNLCVRAVLKAEAEGGRGEHHWIADDIANILFSPLGEGSTSVNTRRPGELIGEQAKLLQDLWTAFDTDGSGTLEQDEVQNVIEAAMERKLTERELKLAFEAMDEDASGAIDFHEFTRWWLNQGDEVKNRVMMKAFEETMASLGSEDVSRVVIDTAAGPEQVRLVSPRGLFRLVIRSKSGHCREFHEWVQTLVTTTRKERGQRRKCVFNEPDVAALTKVFVMRNTLVTTKNKDGWLYHKSEAVGVKASDVGTMGCEVKIFTMPSLLPHKPNLLCTKGYTIIDGITPSEIDRRLWDPESLRHWSLLAGDSLEILKTMDDGDARVTRSFYDFKFPFLPSPIPTTELVLAHTRRIDTDGVIVHAAASGAYDGIIKPRGKKSAVSGEVYCAGLIIAPARKGTASKLTVIACIQPGPGPQIPVAAQRLYNDFFISDQVERIYKYLRSD
jgi:Ca2+-binding EF-hand superfamily protein